MLAYSYHMRWALSCATLVLALFALAMARRIVARWAALAAVCACFSYRAHVDRAGRGATRSFACLRGRLAPERGLRPRVVGAEGGHRARQSAQARRFARTVGSVTIGRVVATDRAGCAFGAARLDIGRLIAVGH